MIQGLYYDAYRPWYKDIVIGSQISIFMFLLAIIDGLYFGFRYFLSVRGLSLLVPCYLTALLIKPSCDLKWISFIFITYFVGNLITTQLFFHAPIFISPMISSVEAFVLQVIPKCYAGHANPYGPRYFNSMCCMGLESLKNISLAKIILLATKTGRWSSVVWFGIMASFFQCYAQTELCFLVIGKLFKIKICPRRALYLRSYYAYQWFTQKIMPFIIVSFCVWVQVVGVQHNTFMAAYNQQWPVVLAISLLFEFFAEILICITHLVLRQFDVVLFEPRMQFAFRSFTTPAKFTFAEVALLGAAISAAYYALQLAIEYDLK